MRDNQEGIIVEVKDTMVKVKLGKHNDCKNCGACPGIQDVFLDAVNKAAAKVGQQVYLEIKEVNMVKASFFTFILPLVSIIITILGFSTISPSVNLNVNILTIIAGILLFFSSMMYVKFLDKELKENRPIITMIKED